MFLRPLWSKALSEVGDIAPMYQWPLVSHNLKEGWLPLYRNGIQLLSASASQQGDCTRKRSSKIVAPHHRQANVGVVLIHKCYQQIIMWRVKLLIYCVNKIDKNATTVRKSRDHNHIGQLMKENFCCQLSCHHLASIKIICTRRVWQFTTPPMKRYWSMQREDYLSRLASIGLSNEYTWQWWGVHTIPLWQNKQLLISLLEQKEKWHQTRHVWYSMKKLKVISQRKWRFH